MAIYYWLKKKRFIIPVAVVLAIAGFMIIKNNAGTQEVTEEEEKKQVETLTVSLQDTFTSEVNLKGTIVPREFITLKSLVSADLVYLAPVGASVSRGQSVARMSDSRIEDNFFTSSQSVNVAQNNLQETQALNRESVYQAELALDSAESGLQLAQNNFANAEKLANQDVKSTQNNAKITYESSYNLVEQVLRFWSDGSLVDFILEDAVVANYELHQQTNQEFGFLIMDFNTVSATPSDNLALSLATLEPVVERTKVFNDLVFRTLNYMVSGNNFSEANINNLKAQAVSFTSQLNAQNTALKNSLSALETVSVTSQASLQSAKNQLQQSQINYNNALAAVESAKRQAEIRELGAQSQITGSQSQLASARGQYGDLTLTAPFDGVIISHIASEGDQLSPGEQVLELGDISGVEINLAIDQKSGDLISVGQEVLINGEVTGVIDEISPSASLETGKINFKVVAGDSKSLIPGDIAEVTVELSYQLEQAVIVPLSVVTVAQNETYVLVYEEGKVAKRVVELSQVRDSHVEVTSGLSEGDSVIITDGEFLTVGEDVEIKSTQ